MIPPSVAVRSGSVLLVSDSEWTALALRAILDDHGVTVGCVRSVADARTLAEAVVPDVVLVDAWLDRSAPPGSALREVRAGRIAGLATPVIAVADEPLPREARLALLSGGAWEVLELPADRAELAARLLRWLAVGRHTRELERVAVWDRADGLHTEQGLLIRARELGADAARFRTPIACLAVHRPAVGDDREADHAAWDATVRAVRRAAGRGSDVVGRVGRDTCVVLAPRTGAEGARHLLRRVRLEVATDPSLPASVPQCAAEVLDPPPRQAEEAIGLLRRAVRAASGNAVPDRDRPDAGAA